MTSKKQKIAFAQILSRLWQNKFLSSRLWHWKYQF